MNESNIRKYAELMKELGLTALEINESTGNVRLERTPAPAAAVSAPSAPVPAPAPAQSAAPVEPNPAGDVIRVKSPMVGVFYAAPAENAEPFVKVGDKVSKGQTLCIVEAMKLMNELPAEQEGIITEICVENGQVVDYGMTLFEMKKA
ncbi:acetyl-CoA carboxylase biotin carboxyl carrier protein [Ruminococcaceae bacterium FB2012]|nr:acetyl-CoA carboxylase biotin carboxyl carrier protein [Ruminococcaceae bacterium FB2012]